METPKGRKTIVDKLIENSDERLFEAMQNPMSGYRLRAMNLALQPVFRAAIFSGFINLEYERRMSQLAVSPKRRFLNLFSKDFSMSPITLLARNQKDTDLNRHWERVYGGHVFEADISMKKKARLLAANCAKKISSQFSVEDKEGPKLADVDKQIIRSYLAQYLNLARQTGASLQHDYKNISKIFLKSVFPIRRIRPKY